MKKIALYALPVILLAGCSTPSTIVLNDGQEIQAVDTPVYDKKSGFYEYEELDGKLKRINSNQVHTIKEM